MNDAPDAPELHEEERVRQIYKERKREKKKDSNDSLGLKLSGWNWNDARAVYAPTPDFFLFRDFAQRKTVETTLTAWNQSFSKRPFINATLLTPEHLQMHLYPLTVGVIDRVDYVFVITER